MALIATSTYNYSHLVKWELVPEMAYCRKVATVNDAAQTMVLGTVLGIVTATGKYKVSKATASDGSEVAAAVVVRETAVPAATDTGVLVMHRGPCVLSKAALVLDATIDTDAEKAAVYAALEARGIQINNAV